MVISTHIHAYVAVLDKGWTSFHHAHHWVGRAAVLCYCQVLGLTCAL